MYVAIFANSSTEITQSFDAVISPYMGVFFVAFLVSLVATPVMGAVATKLGVVDKPDGLRKLHGRPIAYFGGLALFFGWCGGIILCPFLTPHTSHGSLGMAVPIGIVFGAATVTLVGLIDDVRPLRARYKLLGQAIAAGCLISEGVGARVVSGALGALGSALHLDIVGSIPPVILLAIGAFVVVMFVFGACNATNLLDGLDGLAGVVVAIVTITLTLIVIAISMGIYEEGVPYSATGDPLRIVFCVALLGAVLGFLPFNFKPATVFMGDAGSMFLGFLCVTIILMLGEKGDPLLVMAGITVFTVPILDTSLAIVRRIARRMSLSKADAFHLHHLLVRSGLGVRRAVIVIYLISIGFGFLGCAMLFIRLRFVAAVFMVVFSFVAVMAFKIGQQKYFAEKRIGRLKPVDQQSSPEPYPLLEPTITVKAFKSSNEPLYTSGAE